MRSELRLLLCCVELNATQEILSQIPLLLQEETDWDFLLSKAQVHRVLPLLYNALVPELQDYIPAKIFKTLKLSYTETIFRNLYMAGNLNKILTFFKENNILALPFKGPVIAQTVYGNLSLRQFGDLDILVSRDDALKARDILLEHHYTQDFRLSKKEEKVFLNEENFFSLVSKDKKIIVDLHWELSGRYNLVPITLESLQKDFLYITLQGKELATLPPHKLFVYHCIHSTSHCWQHLEWIVCVTELIRNIPEHEWIDIFRWSEELRCKRMVLLGIQLSVDLFHVVIPDSVQNRLREDQRISQLARGVVDTLSGEGSGGHKTSLSWRFAPLHFQIRDNLFDKCHYCVRMLFRPTVAEWQRYKFSSSFAFLRYLQRPFRLFSEWNRRR